MKNCPKCGLTLERRPDQFHWRGRFFHGLVCVLCNALWDDPTDSFMTHVNTDAKVTLPLTAYAKPTSDDPA